LGNNNIDGGPQTIKHEPISYLDMYARRERVKGGRERERVCVRRVGLLFALLLNCIFLHNEKEKTDL
jgi:hypothetical protein